MCLITSSTGRDLNIYISFNLDFRNPGVDTSEVRQNIRLYHTFGIIKNTRFWLRLTPARHIEIKVTRLAATPWVFPNLLFPEEKAA